MRRYAAVYDDDLSEIILQESWVKLLRDMERHPDKYTGHPAEEAAYWRPILFTNVKTAWQKHIRHECFKMRDVRQKYYLFDSTWKRRPDHTTNGTNPAEVAASNEQYDILVHELAEVLEPDEHVIVALRLFGQRNEMHFREIGTTMGLSAAETRQRFDGAREKVRDWYEHQRRLDGGVGFSRPLESNPPTRVRSVTEEHGAWVSADSLFRDDEPAHERVASMVDAPDLLQVLQRQEQAVWDRLMDGSLPRATRPGDRRAVRLPHRQCAGPPPPSAGQPGGDADGGG